MLAFTWLFGIILILQAMKPIEPVTSFTTQDTSSTFSVATSTYSQSVTEPASSTSTTSRSNHSLVGTEVACEHDWKLCLLLGRLLDGPSGRCYPPGDSMPCPGNGSLVLDARALRQGRLRAVCRGNGSCAGDESAEGSPCPECAGGQAAVLLPLGGWGCPGGAWGTEQPEQPGRCVVPDFSAQQENILLVNCSSEVRRCPSHGLLPFEGACYAPLSNATCGAGEWLALDADAARADGQLVGVCAPRRPCGQGAHLLRATGRCHSERQLRRALCPGSELFYAPTGDVVCSRDGQGAGAGLKVVAECGAQHVDTVTEEGANESAATTTTSTIQVVFLLTCVVVDPGGICCPRDDNGNCAYG